MYVTPHELPLISNLLLHHFLQARRSILLPGGYWSLKPD